MAKVLWHWNLQLTNSSSKNKKRTKTDFSGPEPQLESMIRIIFWRILTSDPWFYLCVKLEPQVKTIPIRFQNW
jgi:hypothetical protein